MRGTKLATWLVDSREAVFGSSGQEQLVTTTFETLSRAPVLYQPEKNPPSRVSPLTGLQGNSFCLLNLVPFTGAGYRQHVSPVAVSD